LGVGAAQGSFTQTKLGTKKRKGTEKGNGSNRKTQKKKG